MKYAPLKISVNVTTLVKEISRVKFEDMPKTSRIPDRRKKPSRYKEDLRGENS
jgi:hypothetical protein